MERLQALVVERAQALRVERPTMGVERPKMHCTLLMLVAPAG